MALADMAALVSRTVYVGGTAGLGTLTDPLDIPAAVEALVLNAELEDYDFSGMSVCTHMPVRAPGDITHSVPATMISATHALASGHNGPIVGETCYFRTPAGDCVSATVAAYNSLPPPTAELRLLRFATNPSADLQRYALADNVDEYEDGIFWSFFQNQTMNLSYVSYGTYGTGDAHFWVFQPQPPWGVVPTSGSGRPAFAAHTNGSLLLLGNLASSYGMTDPYYKLSQLNALMAPYSETVLTASIDVVGASVPDYLGSGCRAKIDVGGSNYIGEGIRGIY